MARNIEWFVALIFGLTAVASPLAAAAQDDEEPRHFDRDCMDDYGRRLCDPSQWATIVASFGLEPAEQVQAAGWRGVRVFTVNGYSVDMPAVSILASDMAGYGDASNATVNVRMAEEEGDSDPTIAQLNRPAWTDLWRQATELSRLTASSPERQSDESGAHVTEQSFIDEETGEEDVVVSICLHAWVTVTEVLTDEGVVRRIRNACGTSPVFDASFELSAQALRGFPHCNHLEPGIFRNESSQLQGCLRLEGEGRIAAAEVANVVWALRGGAAFGLAPYLAQTVQLEGSSTATIEGPSEVLAALERLTVDTRRTDLNSWLYTGSSSQVTVTGDIARYGEGWIEVILLEMTWTKKDDGGWQVAVVRLGEPNRFAD